MFADGAIGSVSDSIGTVLRGAIGFILGGFTGCVSVLHVPGLGGKTKEVVKRMNKAIKQQLAKAGLELDLHVMQQKQAGGLAM